MTHGFSPKHLLVPLAAESLGCGKCGSQKAGFVLGSCARAAPAHWRAPLDPHLGPALGNDQQQALTSGKALLAPDDSSGADVGLTSSWGWEHVRSSQRPSRAGYSHRDPGLQHFRLQGLGWSSLGNRSFNGIFTSSIEKDALRHK